MKTNLLYITMLLCATANAQHAEELFKQRYARIGLELGTHQYYNSNAPNPAGYQWATVHSGNIGLVYNMKQYHNINLKVSAIYSAWNRREEILYTYQSGRTGIVNFSSGPYAFLLFPLEVEYYFKPGRRLYVAPSAGFELTVNPFGSDEGGSGLSVMASGFQSSTNMRENASVIPVYAGLRLGVSFSLATKPMLLKMAAVYNRQLRDYLYRGVAANEVNGQRTISQHRMTGHYLGIGLSIIPNKRFFK